MEEPTTHTGIFISFEGIDGSGKSTVSQLLSTQLALHTTRPVVWTREPGGTPVGSHIRSLVSEHTVSLQTSFLLFAADRAEHVATVIKPGLDKGQVIISDRFVDSSRAYQGAGRGIDPVFIESVTQYTTGGIRPHIVFYCRIDSDTAWSRIIARGQALTVFEQEKRSFFTRVIDGYETLFAGDPRVVCLDARRPISDLVDECMHVIMQRFPTLCDREKP